VSVAEVIGTLFIMLMCCVGIYTIGRLVVEGIRRTAGRIHIGATIEDAAVRDQLPAHIPQDRIPGVQL
jgi:hypothetical protein